RACERALAQACSDLDQAAAGAPGAYSRFRTRLTFDPWLRSIAKAVAQHAVSDDPRALVEGMHAQRVALPFARDHLRLAKLTIDANGNATLQRIEPQRKNASPEATWEPVIALLLRRGVRPGRAARGLEALVPAASAETLRTWVFRTRKTITPNGD